ncbi:MAG: gliding motility-associated ABC transporter ATP-binding subunit GldA, partial [candidate division Zixibacteria bacterium]|nr:gliding motility-associated ABC transporter ATP-binding subunit GldA [candidate division Zixibacteria bacterium]
GIRDLIKELAAEKTIVFSTHILQEVEAIADRIVIINEGKIVSEGTQKELEEQVRSSGGGKAELSLEDIFISLLMPNRERKEAVKK